MTAITACLTLAFTFAGTNDPPPNDDCANAQPIAGEGIFAFDNTNATLDGGGDRCTDAPVAHDVWFCWDSPCPTSMLVDTCGGTTVDTVIDVYYGCDCQELSFPNTACDDDSPPFGLRQIPNCGYQSQADNPFVGASTMLIRISSYRFPRGETPGGRGTFAVSCGPTNRPPEPAATCELDGGNCQPPDPWNAHTSDGTEFVVADRFTPAANGAIDHVCWWGAYVEDDHECPTILHEDAFEVRYYLDNAGLPGPLIAGPFTSLSHSLTMTSRGRTGATLMGDIREYLYSAQHTPVPVAAGQCYWIEIRNELTGECTWFWEAGRGNDHRAVQRSVGAAAAAGFQAEDVIAEDMAFCVSVALSPSSDCDPLPPNDECSLPVPISTGESVFFDTSGATTDGPPGDYCDPHHRCQDFPLGDENVHRDIWFGSPPPQTGLLSVGTCDSLFDTKLAVYSGAGCPTGSDFLAANDDACAPPSILPASLGSSTDGDADVPSVAGDAESEYSDCFTAHDHPECDDAVCTARVCGSEGFAFCCESLWYNTCADRAIALCRDSVGEGLQSNIEIPVRGGEPLTIRVGGYRGQGGPGTLSVDLTPRGPEFADLASYAAFANCFTNVCRTSSCTPALFAEPACANSDADADGDVDRLDYVWISFALSP